MRVAVVGCGYWGARHVRVLSALQSVDAVLAVDPRVDELDKLSRLFPRLRTSPSLDDVVEEADAFVVATPASTHASIATPLLRSGKHVLVEKPLATTTAEAEVMVQAAKDSGVTLMAGHTFLYNSAVVALREVIRSGELGDVYYLDTARLNLGLYQADVNVFMDLAPHDISIVNYLLDSSPTRVHAFGNSHRARGYEDVGYLRLEYGPGGPTAQIHVSWLDPCKVRRVTVVGSRRMAVYNDLASAERLRLYDRGVHDETSGDDPLTYRYGDIVSPYIDFPEPLVAEDEHFVSVIRDGVRCKSDGENGLEVVRVLEAAQRSLATGETIDLEHPESGVLDLNRRRTRITGASPRGSQLGSGARMTHDARLGVPFFDPRPMNAEIEPHVGAILDELRETQAYVGADSFGSRFEESWAAFCEAPKAVGVANGTDAIALILRSLNIGPNDEVLVPTNTFVATAEAVWMAGARPVFVDVEPDTLLVSSRTLLPWLTHRTAALIAVDLYGNMPDMTELVEFADQHSLALIEDAAQAHGASWRGRRAGSWGVAAGFSFYPGKNLGAWGDAGAVTTSDTSLADTIRSLGNHGRCQGGPQHQLVGGNSRLDQLQAGLLLAKLDHLDRWNRLREASGRHVSRRPRAGGHQICRRPLRAAGAVGTCWLCVWLSVNVFSESSLSSRSRREFTTLLRVISLTHSSTAPRANCRWQRKRQGRFCPCPSTRT